MLYQRLLKPLLFKFDPEMVHDFFVACGVFFGKVPLLRKCVSLFCNYRGPDISKKVDSLTYRTPFLLGAGFDYNGELLNILPEISLGGVEIGSITARSCEGNQRPRLSRLVKSQSILVNKGLRNDGVESIIRRLKKYPKKEGFVIGVSIARTNDSKTCSTEEGVADYFYTYRRLVEEGLGDYYAFNISCPNAFGGETFANPTMLFSLMSEIATLKCGKPIYVKMPINLEWFEFDALLKVLEKFKMVSGLVIGNLNKNYSDLDFRQEAPAQYAGGLSGKPCFDLSNKLLRETKRAYGDRFTLIGCGGVLSKEMMREKFAAGADLVMLVTGLIWNGPKFIKDLSNYYLEIKNEK